MLITLLPRSPLHPQIAELSAELDACRPWYDHLETLRHLLPEEEAREKARGEAGPMRLSRLGEDQLEVLAAEEAKYK